MRHAKNGLFITFEGTEGCGKSTQSALLVTHLKNIGLASRIVYTREPGGSTIAKHIRSLVLDPMHRMDPFAELFLYEADRAQHVSEVIEPALAANKIVICDRYTDSTIAYQGYARGLDQKVIAQLNRIATRGLRPDRTVFIDTPVTTGLTKARARQNGGDRLEREGTAFHERVYRGFKALARKEPQRIIRIKQAARREDTHYAIVTSLMPLIRRRYTQLIK